MGLRSHWPQALGPGLWPLRFPSPPCGARAPAMAKEVARTGTSPTDSCAWNSRVRGLSPEDMATRKAWKALDGSRPQAQHGHLHPTALEIRAQRETLQVELWRNLHSEISLPFVDVLILGSRRWLLLKKDEMHRVAEEIWRIRPSGYNLEASYHQQMQSTQDAGTKSQCAPYIQ